MSTTVKSIFCQKLQQELPALTTPPLPGNLGQRIYANISARAWALWQNQQTMLINEYRLNLLEATARAFLLQEMEKFLFGEGSTVPPGYVPRTAADVQTHD